MYAYLFGVNTNQTPDEIYQTGLEVEQITKGNLKIKLAFREIDCIFNHALTDPSFSFHH
jgi:hypothetical protein